MPELPEVETIRRGLNKFIIKQEITHTEVLCEKSFIGQPITGTVKAIRRFGKALIIDLDNQKSLMLHLRNLARSQKVNIFKYTKCIGIAISNIEKSPTFFFLSTIKKWSSDIHLHSLDVYSLILHTAITSSVSINI